MSSREVTADDWEALVDDAEHEIHSRWGSPLDGTDDPEFDSMDASVVRETAEAILRPIVADRDRFKAALERIARGPNSAPTLVEPWSRAEALIALEGAPDA